jgi:hypothetical protein
MKLTQGRGAQGKVCAVCLPRINKKKPFSSEWATARLIETLSLSNAGVTSRANAGSTRPRKDGHLQPAAAPCPSRKHQAKTPIKQLQGWRRNRTNYLRERMKEWKVTGGTAQNSRPGSVQRQLFIQFVLCNKSARQRLADAWPMAHRPGPHTSSLDQMRQVPALAVDMRLPYLLTGMVVYAIGKLEVCPR